MTIADRISPLEQIERDELDKAFLAVLKTSEGKRVIFWMLEQCAIYSDAFAGDDNATNYRLGQQASGRKLIAKLDDLDPRTYPKLLLDMAEIRAMDLAAARRVADNLEADEDVD